MLEVHCDTLGVYMRIILAIYGISFSTTVPTAVGLVFYGAY